MYFPVYFVMTKIQTPDRNQLLPYKERNDLLEEDANKDTNEKKQNRDKMYDPWA